MASFHENENQNHGIPTRAERILACISSIEGSYLDQGFFLNSDLEFCEVNGIHGWFNTSENKIESGQLLMAMPKELVLTPKHPFVRRNLNGGDGRETLASVLKKIVTIFRRAPLHGRVSWNLLDVQMQVLVMYVGSQAFKPATNQDPFRYYVLTWPVEEALLPWNWVGPAREILQGSLTGEWIDKMEEMSDLVFEKIIEPVINTLHPESQADFSMGSMSLKETFQYACSVFASRSHLKSNMIPLLDLINGISEGHSTVNCKYTLMASTPQYRDATVHAVHAIKDIGPGQEVIISYGALTTGNIFMKYGVVPKALFWERNTHDEVVLGAPMTLLPPRSDKLRWRALNSWDYTIEDCEKDIQEFGLIDRFCLKKEHVDMLISGQEPEELKILRQLMGLLTFDEETLKQCMKLQLVKAAFYPNGLVDKVYLDLIDAQLQSFSTSLQSCQQDFERSSNRSLSRQESNAILCCVVERELLYELRWAVHLRYTPNWEDLMKAGGYINGMSCFRCGRTLNLKRCGRCQMVSYCGAQCQRAHWKKHKPLCLPQPEWLATGTTSQEELIAKIKNDMSI
mmetsp:Transcript_5086/g.7020  ORF Transcript_5086/g.7020 Transcript_5086/m.7020 type:complete len:569 (+) Transcript_5086:96-1802(+)